MDSPAGSASSDPAERWAIVRDHLDRALALPQHDRAAYVDKVCTTDESLREELQSLLEAALSDDLATPELPGRVLANHALSETVALGQRISHYRIDAKIGAGGMGAVYKATDLNLGRTAAIKVISRQGWARDSKSRFEREAKAASALNHPNIVTIYEYGNDAGVDYIAMEFVEGATLSTHLAAAQPPLHTRLSYARQIAAALAKAHATGIIHRDLKPGNIMVTPDGIVKVLDFGLAKQDTSLAGVERTETELTRAGSVLGTPAYMAPEQALGEAATQSADIFSYGVILYEMVCGVRPFRGETHAAILRQVIGKEPPPVLQANPNTPPEVVTLIADCLKKEPAERLASMKLALDILGGSISSSSSLTTPRTGSSSTRSPVAPASSSGTRRMAIAASAVVALAVLGGYGVYRYRATAAAAPPSATGNVVVLPNSSQDWVAQGNAYLDRMDKTGYREKAMEAFQKAAELEPQNISAFAGLTDAYLARYGTNPDQQWAKLALESAQQAMRINPHSSVVLASHGAALSAVGRNDEAAASFREALELDPQNARIYLKQAVHFARLPDPKKAEDSFRRAIALAPKDWYSLAEFGRFLYRSGRIEESLALYQKGFELSPDNTSLLSSLGAAYSALGRREDAARALQQSVSLLPTPRGFSNLGTLLFYMGRYREAADTFARAVELDAQSYRRWGNWGDALRWTPGSRAESNKPYQRAIELVSEQLAKTPTDQDALSSLAEYSAKSGQTEQALQTISKVKLERSTKAAIWFKAAIVYEVCQQRQKALDALEQAVVNGQSLNEIKQDPELIALRRDARYSRIVTR